jgi:hypothetical protein
MKQFLVVLSATALVLVVYYGHGATLLFWPDSVGYLTEALRLKGALPDGAVTERTLGYPIFLLAPLSLPWPALAVIVGQGLLAGLALYGVHWHAAAAARAFLADHPSARATVGRWLPVAIVLAGAYGGLHFQIQSLLPEALFAVLALAAVLAVSALVRMLPPPWPASLPYALAAAAAASLPMLVKPHWLLAAMLLATVAGAWLALAAVHRTGSRAKRLCLAALALAAPVLVVLGLVQAHRSLQTPDGRTATSLFGARSVFCNHLHLVDDALRKHAGLRLHDDPRIHLDVVDYVRGVRARHRGAWPKLGFEGDLCMYDATHDQLMTRLLPDPEARRQLYIGGVLAAAWTDPLPFARKVVAQYWHGIASAFTRFAIQAREPRAAYAEAAERLRLPPYFTAGVGLTGDAGPLGSYERLRRTWPGTVLHAVLAVLFTGLGIAYIVLLAAMALLVPLRWRVWTVERQRDVMALVLLPVAAVLAHHTLIALAHTFDVWRYAFNTFFVSLAFMPAAAMLLWDENREPE